MTPPRGSCVYCERILHGRSDLIWDRPLAETSRFVIVPSKGAIVPGWVLVVSKDHCLCTAAMENVDVNALNDAVLIAKRSVERAFGLATLFEHGPVAEGTALGCGVDHLHVHVAPLRFSLRTAFEHLFPRTVWTGIARWRDLQRVHEQRTPYVAIQEPGFPMTWSEAPPNIRQPLRRAVASAVGIAEEFDYSVHPQTQNVIRTVESLRAT